MFSKSLVKSFSNKLTLKEICKMIDISSVTANSTIEDVDEMIYLAKKYKFIAVFGMPCYMETVKKLINDEKDIKIGGLVGFPSGAESVEIKKFQAMWCLKNGADEVDMVLNIGWLISGCYKKVLDDIKCVKNVIGEIPLKVILETTYLNDNDIKKGSEIIVKSGAQYIKTGTGWAPAIQSEHINIATKIEHINIIKNTVGNSIKIKAAGGINNLNLLKKLIDLGVSRFGIGVNSVKKIIKEYNK